MCVGVCVRVSIHAASKDAIQTQLRHHFGETEFNIRQGGRARDRREYPFLIIINNLSIYKLYYFSVKSEELVSSTGFDI